MIPLGSDDSARLVIGHNVGYDRVRLGDEYRLERSGTRYLDTMALHIAVAGMTSQQRLVWNSCKGLTKEELKLSLEDRFGKALSYAGMAVSVTSVTNIVAFMLGATTVIPALRSFCLFCR